MIMSIQNSEETSVKDTRQQPSFKRRKVLYGLAGGALLPLVGCGGGGSGMGGTTMGSTASASNVVVPTGGTFKAPTPLTNTSSSAGTFAATLTAKPASAQIAVGTATTVWAFNGTSPGPMIDVKEGDTVSIVFSNQLAQASTIHWHGLPVPASQDGNPMDTVPAGGSRTYTFTLPMGSAGTYWFHPHPHETSHQQVYMGLAGCFIVRPAVDPLAGMTERIMMVTDLRLDANNQIAANTMMDDMNGREGDQLMVNGVKQPVIAVQPGATERWRIVNATNARYLRLSLQGHALSVVGHDGGLVEQAHVVTEMLLAPAQRVELVVQTSTSAGQSYTFQALAYNRGTMGMAATPVDINLLTLSTTLSGVAAAFPIPTTLRVIPPMASPVRTQTIVLKETMGMGMSNQFLINNQVFDPARVDLITNLNDTEDWTIENLGDMDHPFHIHGTQFQLVSSTRAGTVSAPGYRAWIDVINVRSKETVRIRIQQTMLGKRMFHCHILEHEDQGMMGVLDVR
jgi:suppressor of ftsI